MVQVVVVVIVVLVVLVVTVFVASMVVSFGLVEIVHTVTSRMNVKTVAQDCAMILVIVQMVGVLVVIVNQTVLLS